MNWTELAIGFAGATLGAMVRFEIEFILSRKERAKQSLLQQQMVRLLSEIHDEITPKG